MDKNANICIAKMQFLSKKVFNICVDIHFCHQFRVILAMNSLETFTKKTRTGKCHFLPLVYLYGDFPQSNVNKNGQRRRHTKF